PPNRATRPGCWPSTPVWSPAPTGARSPSRSNRDARRAVRPRGGRLPADRRHPRALGAAAPARRARLGAVHDADGGRGGRWVHHRPLLGRLRAPARAAAVDVLVARRARGSPAAVGGGRARRGRQAGRSLLAVAAP